MHTDRSPVRLVMYEDRLELENPGGLYGRITVDDLGKASADTRNLYIAGALEIMIGTENRFSGIPTVENQIGPGGELRIAMHYQKRPKKCKWSFRPPAFNFILLSYPILLFK